MFSRRHAQNPIKSNLARSELGLKIQKNPLKRVFNDVLFRVPKVGPAVLAFKLRGGRPWTHFNRDVFPRL